MPIFALYTFGDTGGDIADSAVGDGAQDGIYLNGAAATGGQVVLDGQNDIAKIYPDASFQLDRGTLEISFVQTAHTGTGPNTVLSRDTLGDTPGGYNIDALSDGTIRIVHETDGGSESFATPPGFNTPGDQISVTYAWDQGGAGGALRIENVTTGETFEAAVPASLTMDMGANSAPWMVGAGQDLSSPGVLNDVNQHFNGSVQTFSLSDTVDILPGGDPVANPDAASTDEDTPVEIPVLANDAGDALSLTGGSAANGTVSVTADGTLLYTPDEDFNGTDTVTYDVTDATGATASSTVTVTVRPVNDAPVANPDSAATAPGTPVTFAVLTNDTDVDGDALAITGTPVTADGTVTVGGDGQLTFTPSPGFTGTATITYDITDGQGGIDTGTATVTVGSGPAPTRDGIVFGTGSGDLIDTAYTGDNDGDRVDAGDALLPGAAPDDDFIIARGGDDTILSGLGDDQVFGNQGNDSVDAGAGNDTVMGGYGNDTILGRDGSDLAFGMIGDDVIDTGRTGVALPDLGYPGLYPADADPLDDLDTVFGGQGNDTIRTGDDADQLYGGMGADSLDGGIDDDTIDGGRGNDTIIGAEGNDLINGALGDDLIYGGLTSGPLDVVNIPDATDLRPDNGQDTIFGGQGNDTIIGQDDDDQLFGGAGNDSLDGNIDDDTIFGGRGNDTIIGGEGNDSLSGGSDRDVFVAANGGDLIDGNEGGDDFDTLDLRGSGPLRVTFAADNPENGTVTFLDAAGLATGTMSFVNIENVIPCFTPGTLIATPRGEVPVEDLRAGDRVVTRDNGLQEIRWTGAKAMPWHALSANPHLQPVLIKRGSLGEGLPERDMMVSPNHRMLVANDRTALYFDEHEVLVAAKHLVGGQGIHAVDSIGTTYLHFMFDQHEVVLANGAWTESFQPGDYSLKGMGNAQRSEIFDLFPELRTEEGVEGYSAARRTLKRHEARLLVK